MNHMNDFDWLDLSARQLRVLVTVLEAGSVTAAAQQLNLSQSAISHTLDRLRGITHDPLFVKSGRRVAATARAEAIGAQAKSVLRDLQALTQSEDFDPLKWHTTLNIAANDFQRDLLLPALTRRLREQARHATVRLFQSHVPSAEALRNDQLQLIISPRPPDATDIMHRRLFEDRYCVYFDPQVREAPRTRSQFLTASHATVIYEGGRPLDLDAQWQSVGLCRRIVLQVPGFAAMGAFLLGTPLLMVAPKRMAPHNWQGLAQAPLPVTAPRLPMFAIWHQRYQIDPAHQWLRQLLVQVAQAKWPAM